LKWPNQNLFHEYGNWDYPESPISKCQFIFIRNGVSHGNIFEEDLLKRARE